MIEEAANALPYREQQTTYYQWGKTAIACFLLCLISFSGMLLFAGIFAPILFAIIITSLLSIKPVSRNLIALMFIAATILFYLANQLSNTADSVNMNSAFNIMFRGTSFLQSIMFQVWPAVLWWLFGLFKKMKLDLYVLGFASTQVINWILSVELMRSDSRDALAWIIIVFAHPFAFALSLLTYHIIDSAEGMMKHLFQSARKSDSN